MTQQQYYKKLDKAIIFKEKLDYFLWYKTFDKVTLSKIKELFDDITKNLDSYFGMVSGTNISNWVDENKDYIEKLVELDVNRG